MLAWRPLITIAFILLGLGLAQPGRVQMMSLHKIAQAAGGVEQAKPAQVIVADTVNHAAISFDGVERAFTDALTGELKETYTFTPVERAAVEAATKELGLVPPYSIESQVLLAEKLQCAYVITSTIDRANIEQSPEGKYVAVYVTTTVVSKVTRLPLVSFMSADRSVPRTEQFKQNEQFHEALSIAASHATCKLAELRILYATVLTSRDRGRSVVLRGGSNIGMQQEDDVNHHSARTVHR